MISFTLFPAISPTEETALEEEIPLSSPRSRRTPNTLSIHRIGGISAPCGPPAMLLASEQCHPRPPFPQLQVALFFNFPLADHDEGEDAASSYYAHTGPPLIAPSLP